MLNVVNYGSIVKTSEKRPTSLQGPKDLFPMWSLFGGFTVRICNCPTSIMIVKTAVCVGNGTWLPQVSCGGNDCNYMKR